MAFDHRQHKAAAAGGAQPSRPGRVRGRRLAIAAGETLFEAGEAKDDLVYRIRKGAVAVEPADARVPTGEGTVGGAAPVKVHNAGEFAGLGFLDAYPARALALVALEVVVWSRSDFERLARRAARFSDMRDEAIRLEFVWRRAQCVAEGRAMRAAGAA